MPNPTMYISFHTDQTLPLYLLVLKSTKQQQSANLHQKFFSSKRKGLLSGTCPVSWAGRCYMGSKPNNGLIRNARSNNRYEELWLILVEYHTSTVQSVKTSMQLLIMNKSVAASELFIWERKAIPTNYFSLFFHYLLK